MQTNQAGMNIPLDTLRPIDIVNVTPTPNQGGNNGNTVEPGSGSSSTGVTGVCQGDMFECDQTPPLGAEFRASVPFGRVQVAGKATPDCVAFGASGSPMAAVKTTVGAAVAATAGAAAAVMGAVNGAVDMARCAVNTVAGILNAPSSNNSEERTAESGPPAVG